MTYWMNSMTKSSMPTLSEIENDLARVMSPIKAREIRLAWEADRNRVKELEGIINYFNNCGDVSRVMERTF